MGAATWVACDDNSPPGSGGGGASSTSSSSSSASTTSAQSSTGSASTTGTGANLCVPGTTEACYSGPAGTLGVGACKSGMHTCAADGASYGSCVGEVDPTTESCLSSADDDCDGSAPPCAGWVQTIGGASFESVRAIVALSNGHLVVAGAFDGQLAAASANSNGARDIFLAELDALGSVVWIKTFGSTGNDEPLALAVDLTGSIVLVGTFGGAMNIGPLSLSGVGGEFIAKFQSSGVPSVAVGIPSAPRIHDMGLDAAGNVVLTALQSGTFDWGGGTLDGKSGSAVVVRLQPSLQFSSASVLEELHDFPDDLPASVAPNGDVVLTGSFQETVDFGSGIVPAIGFTDLFVQRVNSNAATTFARAWGTLNFDAGQAVVLHGTGVIEGGVFAAPVALGGPSNPTANQLFVAGLDASGTVSWATSFANAGANPSIDGIVVAPSGHVFVTANTDSSIAIGSTTLDLGSTGGRRTMLAELDSNGAPVAAKRLTSGSGDCPAHAIAVGPNGEIYVGGAFRSNVDGPTGLIPSTGDYDGFVYKLVP